MAHLERLIQKSEGLSYEGRGKFVAKCPGNTCEDCKLTFQLDTSEEWGASKPTDWNGKFSCQKNCSTIQIFSNLNICNEEIFFDRRNFESHGGNWDSIFSMEEAFDFLRYLTKSINEIFIKNKNDSKLNNKKTMYYYFGVIDWLMRDGIPYLNYKEKQTKEKRLQDNFDVSN
jgi:hypothetical protein